MTGGTGATSSITAARPGAQLERCADCGEVLFVGVEAWYRADAARLQRFVRRVAADRGVPSSALDSEDVVHEAFERLQQELDTVERPAAWLRTVAERIVARVHHAQRYVASRDVGDYLAESQVPQWTSLTPPAADVWNKIAVQTVMGAIAALPDRQRAAVYLAKVEGMSEAEIAERLDIACSTVGVHVHRALRALRSQLSAVLLDRSYGLEAHRARKVRWRWRARRRANFLCTGPGVRAAGAYRTGIESSQCWSSWPNC